MDNKDKIIVALDVDNLNAAEALVEELHPYVGAFKVGLELLNSAGAPQVVSALQTEKTKLFFDGKFKDIPNTTAGASRAVSRLGVWMFNVHAMGGKAMMESAKEAAEYTSKTSGTNCPLVIAVTVLTSFDTESLKAVGFNIDNEDALRAEVMRLALLAKASGLDGVVASPQEVDLIREACGDDFVIVTPGVRPIWAVAGDQKRVTLPSDAIKNGADYIVIGRPITKPPTQIGTPAEAAQKILEEINERN
jgi:orotidine-5'-phosphate decarboxylase